MASSFNWTLSYLIDLFLMVNALFTLVIISRIRWVFTLLVAIGFYIFFAIFLFIMGCEFFSIVYLIVYLGGIMTLFLFAIMYLNASSFLFINEKKPLMFLFQDVYFIFDLMILLIAFFDTLFSLFWKTFYSWTPFYNHISRQDLLTTFRNLDFSFMQLVNHLGLKTYGLFSTVVIILVDIFSFGILISAILYGSDQFISFGSDSTFLFLGSALVLLSHGLFTDFGLEFLLVGFILWLGFIATLTLLYRPVTSNFRLVSHSRLLTDSYTIFRSNTANAQLVRNEISTKDKRNRSLLNVYLKQIGAFFSFR